MPPSAATLADVVVVVVAARIRFCRRWRRFSRLSTRLVESDETDHAVPACQPQPEPGTVRRSARPRRSKRVRADTRQRSRRAHVARREARASAVSAKDDGGVSDRRVAVT